MPRPVKCRRICSMPHHRRFACESGQAEVTLTFEEYEALRLIDYLGLGQAECAAQMGVARTTVQRIYEGARHKLACFLVEGGALQIAGGTYELCARPDCRCAAPDCARRRCGCAQGSCPRGAHPPMQDHTSEREEDER